MSICESGSLFNQPWWLDAVAPGCWEEVVIESGGNIRGRWPYVLKKKFGLRFLGMPPLTPRLGPWLAPIEAKRTKVLSDQKDILFEMVEMLPSFDLMEQNFNLDFVNWLPLYWKGFQQTTRYTYIVDSGVDAEGAWGGLQENIRREIRKAQNRFNLRVETDLGLDEFLNINDLTFKRQGISPPYSHGFIRSLDDACIKNGARRTFFAVDDKNAIHAVIYVVWDDSNVYYLMGGGDPSLRTSGAQSLLIWEAIKFSLTSKKNFDFAGSMIEPIERFFRSFGSAQVPYMQISKINSKKMKTITAVRQLFSIPK